MSDTDSEYDSHDEDEIDIYEPEEISDTKYNIVLCELYNEIIHGIPDSTSGVEKHYIVTHRFKIFNTKLIQDISCYINNEYLYLHNQSHTIFINYRNIITRPNNIKAELGECIYLNGQECVCILKTIWIRLIQRKWKMIYKQRQNIIRQRCSITALMHREIKGIWPQYCLYMPGIKGMLSDLL